MNFNDWALYRIDLHPTLSASVLNPDDHCSAIVCVHVDGRR